MNISSAERIALPVLLILALFAGACVNVDPESGKTIPRGNQRHEYSVVKENAKQLKTGMSKMDVLLLLGSPAEKERFGDVWIYLPERAAVLIPSSALKLEFESNKLVKHDYETIVFGQR
ncbi:MAG: outer membrane protein assembly factor BamE domain-containing protein [Planctomycetota bacterium]|jgi:outer membrane protein assembly factor BamE (lipoprotein component of BamABCDE complex)